MWVAVKVVSLAVVLVDAKADWMVAVRVAPKVVTWVVGKAVVWSVDVVVDVQGWVR